MASNMPAAAARLFFIGLAIGASMTIVPEPARAQTALPQSSVRIRSYVSAAFQIRDLPGAAAIVIHDGDVQIMAYGHDANGKAISADTRFYIGSMSKAFTAAAVMQLVEQGRLNLDSPVRSYLPEFILADPRAAGITVRQLLNHTSGMDNSTFDEWRQPQSSNLKDAVMRLRKAGLARPPGAGFSYHNPNYTVLARLVEVVSSQPFSDYLHDNLFLPLGMTDTESVDFVDEWQQRAALGHVSAFAHFFPFASPHFFINGAGGVLTTPNDYAKWLQMQIADGPKASVDRILSQASIEAMHTPSKNSAGYGFGWNRAASGRVSHSGGLPTYGGYVAIQDHNAVAVLAPVVPAAAPLRDIGLGVLGQMQGKAVNPMTPDPLAWIDYALVGLLVLILAFCTHAIVTSRSWAQSMMGKPVWRRVLAFTPHMCLVALVFFGIPYLVSRVISWSWLWLWCDLPVGVTVLLTSAAAATLVAVVRLVVIARLERRQLAT